MYQIYIHKKATGFPKPDTDYNSFPDPFTGILSRPRCRAVTLW